MPDTDLAERYVGAATSILVPPVPGVTVTFQVWVKRPEASSSCTPRGVRS
jgi:hypothetical protein